MTSKASSTYYTRAADNARPAQQLVCQTDWLLCLISDREVAAVDRLARIEPEAPKLARSGKHFSFMSIQLGWPLERIPIAVLLPHDWHRL